MLASQDADDPVLGSETGQAELRAAIGRASNGLLPEGQVSLWCATVPLLSV